MPYSALIAALSAASLPALDTAACSLFTERGLY